MSCFEKKKMIFFNPGLHIGIRIQSEVEKNE